MKLGIFVLAMGFSSVLLAGEHAGVREIPSGVKLAAVDASVVANATKRLNDLLASRSAEAMTEIMADKQMDTRPPFMLGTFLSSDLAKSSDFDLSAIAKGSAVIPLTKDLPLRGVLVGASSPAQRKYLADKVLRMLPAGRPHSYRQATFDELAQIWYYVSWDLNEPLLVTTWGNARYAFNFDSTGQRITWIERISDPCFELRQGDKQVLPCHCLVVVREALKWSAGFRPANDTNTCHR